MSDLGPREPRNDMVICPNCTCQFVAIPVDVQAEIDALREKNEQQSAEIERLRGEVEDWRSGIVNAMGETPCRDASERHCSCVPFLRREIAALRERIREARRLITIEHRKDGSFIFPSGVALRLFRDGLAAWEARPEVVRALKEKP